jgi:hypothetical protein
MHDQVYSAIERRRLIEFVYQGLPRIAEPHDYGSINGVEQVLVYQIGGKSRSKSLPDWRLIRVTEITMLKILEKSFPGGRAVSSNKHKKWDQLFIRVTSAD